MRRRRHLQPHRHRRLEQPEADIELACGVGGNCTAYADANTSDFELNCPATATCVLYDTGSSDPELNCANSTACTLFCGEGCTDGELNCTSTATCYNFDDGGTSTCTGCTG